MKLSENPDIERSLDAAAREGEAQLFERFSERLFARQPVQAAQLAPEHRARIARDSFEFFYTRSENVAVRVFETAGRLTAIETLMPDCPFIVDSLIEYFHERGTPVTTLLHPVLHVARDASGKVLSLETASAAEQRESLVHAELELALDGDAVSATQREVARIVNEVYLATEDFEAMTGRALAICEETAAVRELVEVRDFLRWLVQGGLVFLAYRRYTVESHDGAITLAADQSASLGTARGEHGSRFDTPRAIAELDAAHRRLLFEGPALIVGKTRSAARVHRRRPMEDLTLRRTDSSGRVTGFDRFLGLFTSKAYVEEAQHIPMLRAKFAEILRSEQAAPGSHDFKELVSAFNSLPKEELFRASVAELRSQLDLILDLKSQLEVRLAIYPDPVRGNVAVLVVMPRERFSAEVRQKIQDTLGRHLGGPLVYYHLALGEGYTARLHFCFAAPSPPPEIISELSQEVSRLARTWHERLRERLVERSGAQRSVELIARWGDAFDAGYQASTPVERAVGDIERMEALLAGAELGLELLPLEGEADGGQGELRMYEVSQAPTLSDLVPMLQNFAIRVVSEEAHELRPHGDGRMECAFLQTFRVSGIPWETLGPDGAKVLGDALSAVYTGRAENDLLNALTVKAGLSWREVALLRGYLAAAFQMRLAPARPALRRVLLQDPELSRLLVELFNERLDPNRETSQQRIAELRGRYLECLGAIDNIADDRTARALLSMVEATVRTNYFLPPPAPDPYIALKFESARIANLTDTLPLFEIHVSSPRMEGCHLRAGKVARGGIRFSDRPDDYRTEILDLMKTQTVKNAIIVPVGAKGGFIVKPHGQRPTGREEAVQAYRTLISAMLDLTDKRPGEQPAHPEGVKVLDDDGPYLVVAADKGTAAFSDIANEIAEQRGFWLGDAFASGGKHGYDHKAMGITARGAWESIKRHLREMGRDPVRGKPITMVGIGDMSGDVFGNGLLVSDNVKLIAAFDHRHIFIDPDPDPARSYAERKRLFELPNSQWSDYRSELLSSGGGIFRRGQKRIILSPEAQSALGCDAAELDSDSLVRAILRADVDLLYNGGIGTYVKAASETDPEVGDHANDACRVNAREIRAKIVAEGGNLGFTQRARVEYALSGGRINTDAIDNSAGVDTSDHEVNLKILLKPVLESGRLSFEDRNVRLRDCTREVGEQVLRDNRDQVLLLSLEQSRSRARVELFADYLAEIEHRGLLRSHEEALPSPAALRQRHPLYPGLSRPELAVITAYTKIGLTARLSSSELVNDPCLVERYLMPYFPPSIVRDFGDYVGRHGLCRELIATRLANEIVDVMGSTFIFEFATNHGASALEVARAWIVGSAILDVGGRVERLKAREMASAGEESAFFALERAVRRASRWFLMRGRFDAVLGDLVARFKADFARLAGCLDGALVGSESQSFERSYRELRAAVHEEELAHDLARLDFADHLLNVLDIGSAQRRPAPYVGMLYFGLARHIDFALLQDALRSIRPDDSWQRRAARELADELLEARARLCVNALELSTEGSAFEQALSRLIKDHQGAITALERLFAELRAQPNLTLAALQVGVRAIARLAHAN